MVQLFLEGLCDLLAPPTCAACRAPLAQRAEGFCGACAPLIDLVPRPPGCDDLDACHYGGPLREALHRFKYEGAHELAPALARYLVPCARGLRGIERVTAVPLHPRRLRARGYNQAALLARLVARALSRPFAPWALARISYSEAQVGRSRAERMAELAHAFGARASVAGHTYLVVDDVRTTGATLAEARRALLAGGAARVCTLALACARPEEESAALAGL